MHSLSTHKFLYLLNILNDDEYTKNEIIKKFKLNNLKITKPLITNYINKYTKNSIKIIEKINSNREKIYSIEKKPYFINFSQEERKAISDVKKFLIMQKNPTRIRRTMRLFYKLAHFIKDEEARLEFIDFGYYSTINWGLVLELERHCKENNLIEIDYILPKGEGKIISIFPDCIEVSAWSERLYLRGVFEGGKQYSHLPIDRIYAVKKIKKKNIKPDLSAQIFTYIIDEKTYEKATLDEREKIIKKENGLIEVQAMLDDDFYIIQRLLYFCPKIYHISNERIKKLYIEKLEQVKSSYGKIIDK